MRTAYEEMLESIEMRKKGIYPLASVDDDDRNWMEACGCDSRGIDYMTMKGLCSYEGTSSDNSVKREFKEPLIGQWFFPIEHIGIAGGKPPITKEEVSRIMDAFPELEYRIEGSNILLNRRLSGEEENSMNGMLDKYENFYSIEMPPTRMRKMGSKLLLTGLVLATVVPYAYFAYEGYQNSKQGQAADAPKTDFLDTRFPPPHGHNLTSEKAIIFRDDDAQAWASVNTSFYNVTQTLLERGVPQTIGVIPDSPEGYSIGTDPVFLQYLKDLSKSPDIELALHGYQHTPYEFRNLTEQQSREVIESGLEIFNSTLGFRPTTIVPPNYEFSPDVLKACSEENFTRFSSYIVSDPDMWAEKPPGMLHVPGTVSMYEWSESRHKSFDEIRKECEESLEKYDAAVLVLHHLTYLEKDGRINQTAYETLLKTIDWAKQKETEGYGLMTIGEYGKK